MIKIVLTLFFVTQLFINKPIHDHCLKNKCIYIFDSFFIFYGK